MNTNTTPTNNNKNNDDFRWNVSSTSWCFHAVLYQIYRFTLSGLRLNKSYKKMENELTVLSVVKHNYQIT